MGGGGTSSTTTANLPPELSELYRKSADRILDFQNDFPLSDAMGNHRRGVASANDMEQSARSHLGGLYAEQPMYRNADRLTRQTQSNLGSTFGGAQSMKNQADRMMRNAPGAGRVGSRIDYIQQTAGARPDFSADAIANDAGLQAAKGAFQQTAMPMIGNQMAAMGLGDSGDHGQTLANAWAASSTPHVQAAQQREMDRSNRMYQGAVEAAGAQQDLASYVSGHQYAALDAKAKALGLQNQTNQIRTGLAGQMGDLAQERWNRQKGAIDTAMGVGGVFRGIEDDRFKSAYDDFLRQQGLAEKALYAPFGQATAERGSTTTSSGK